ncbi:MAG TPA: DUF58 domain-containing protein [Lacipirellulaceae bacterium]|nr:DUF58 domain-containing protein [Lacipirellulaceae bacterium]
MTTASKRSLHPEVIKRIGRLEVRARHIVEGLLSGMHRSPYFGQSVEFLQHREYAPGDDLRRVDWKVWAKQDRLYVKQYQEDTNLRCCMLVDVSASMEYGSGAMTKYEYAVTAAAALAYLLLHQHDAVGCAVFDESIRQTIPLRTSTSHLTTIVRSLGPHEPRDKTQLFDVLARAAETYPRRGMMVLISDLLVDPDDAQRGLRLLRQRGHDVLVLHVMDDDELDFPFARPARFEGLETADHLTCNPRALRDGYLAALGRFLETIRHGCAHDNIDYTLIRTSTPLDAALTAFLTHRQRERPH